MPDGVSKYESLHGINIREIISNQLNLSNEFPLKFENDAGGLVLGEAWAVKAPNIKCYSYKTRNWFCAAFIEHKKLLRERVGIPGNGYSIIFLLKTKLQKITSLPVGCLKNTAG